MTDYETYDDERLIVELEKFEQVDWDKACMLEEVVQAMDESPMSGPDDLCDYQLFVECPLVISDAYGEYGDVNEIAYATFYFEINALQAFYLASELVEKSDAFPPSTCVTLCREGLVYEQYEKRSD